MADIAPGPARLALSALEVANRADLRDTFGLLAIRAFVETDLPTEGVGVQVAFGEAVASLAAADCLAILPDGRWRLLFHLNTHRIADGPHRLDVTLRLPNNTQARFPAAVLNIANDTALGREVAADLEAFGSPIIFGSVVDSGLFPYGSGRAAILDPEDGDDIPLSLDPAADAAAAQAHLRRWGFVVLPDLLPADLIADFRRQMHAAIAQGALHHRPGSSERMLNAHTLPAGRRIWLFPPVLAFLERYFGDKPCACQTLTFVNGSEQNAHQDTIHLTPYPAGYMAGVWVALEDVQPGSGELFVYPGSHRTHRVRARELGLAKVSDDYTSYGLFDGKIRKLVEAGGYDRVLYRAKAGQILVWHENLVHGGSPRLMPERSRLSIVSHYFAKGAVCYYDSRGEAASLELSTMA